MRKLTKTLVWAFVGMGIGYMIGGYGSASREFMMIAMAGFPAGWSALTKTGMIPFSIVGFVIHLLISIVLGWIILPVQIISGILELRSRRI